MIDTNFFSTITQRSRFLTGGGISSVIGRGTNHGRVLRAIQDPRKLYMKRFKVEHERMKAQLKQKP